MTTKQTTTYAANYRLQAYQTRQMNTDGTGFNTCKECHKTEYFLNHTTTDHKEGEQLEDRRNVGESSCNFGDGTESKGPILDVYDDGDDDDYDYENQRQNYISNYI